MYGYLHTARRNPDSPSTWPTKDLLTVLTVLTADANGRYSRLDLCVELVLQLLPLGLHSHPRLFALVVAGHLIGQVVLVGIDERMRCIKPAEQKIRAGYGTAWRQN